MANQLNPLNGAAWNINKLSTLLDTTDGVAGTGITAVERFLAPQEVVLTLTAQSITTTDAGANGAHGSKLIYTMPAGNIAILGATTDLTISRVGTNLTTAAAVVAALGTTATATDNSTLTTTEANIIPSTVATLTAGAGVAKGESTAGTTFDGTSVAVPVYLNFAVPDAGSTGNDALLVNGTIKIAYVNLGDN
jgi:hypothetical protein